MQHEQKIKKELRIPQLDGLRGIAILMVLGYHFFPNNLICNFGWTGVDLFFVLSGFLITGRLVPFLGQRNMIAVFYRNRFLRIVPLYFGFLVVFFTAWFLLSSRETIEAYTYYGDHWWNFFLFIQNWIFANNLLESKTHLQHLWSVAVEEQIYLVFPLLLMLFRGKKLFGFIVTTLIIVIISRCIYFIFFIPDNESLKIFFNTFFRFDAFLSGVIIYLIYTRNTTLSDFSRIFNLSGFFCFLALATYIIVTRDAEKENSFIVTGGFTMIAIMYASLLQITLSQSNSLINYITNLKILRYTGKISYGIYIIHWPLFLTGYILLNKTFVYFGIQLNSIAIHYINVGITLPLTYFLSHVSFKYYESYFLKRKIKLC